MKRINAARAEFRQSILYSWQACMGASPLCDTHSSKKEKPWPCPFCPLFLNKNHDNFKGILDGKMLDFHVFFSLTLEKY